MEEQVRDILRQAVRDDRKAAHVGKPTKALLRVFASRKMAPLRPVQAQDGARSR